MLDRVDRVLLAVPDRHAAATNFAELLGARSAREAPSRHLGALRTIVSLGESEVELCEPNGDGPIRRHMDRWGEGLFAGGLSTPELPKLLDRLGALNVKVTRDGDQAFIAPTDAFGMNLVLSPSMRRDRAPGPANFLYEITNTLVTDWRKVAARFAEMFGLDQARFSPIKSAKFGYEGTLTLFDPPARLDRIELSQVVDPNSAMGRFVAKRGDSLYMCYLDVEDVPDIVRRLDKARARWTPRTRDGKPERDGLWVHPSALNGLLLGISRRTLAWEWSGRPNLVEPLRA
ncbi:MAG TPA: hypothetical protein VEU47_17640 [Candidatus Cybelea sp.]|nr:hypothetical protein [Candidatus Cybelea sp.]